MRILSFLFLAAAAAGAEEVPLAKPDGSLSTGTSVHSIVVTAGERKAEVECRTYIGTGYKAFQISEVLLRRVDRWSPGPVWTAPR